jgi:hypothetical protein
MRARYGINNFVYAARRPFHPRRLFALLQDKFILLQNKEQDEEEGDEGEMEEDDSNASDDEMESVQDFDQQEPSTILANKKAHPTFGPVLRSKGFFWLATRSLQFGEWSQAGGMLTVGCGGPWFDELPRDLWPEDQDIVESIERDFQHPWGDRRQEIVFIGEGIDQDQIYTHLDECLMNDEEMGSWEEVMKEENLSSQEKETKLGTMWEDGWEVWPPLDIVEEENNGMELDNETGKQKKRLISEHLGHSHKPHDHGHIHASTSRPRSLKQTVMA